MSIPLGWSPIVSTGDLDEAQAILSTEMTPVRFLTVRNPGGFRLNMNGIHLGRTLIGVNQFTEQTEVDGGVVEDAVIFTLSMGPAAIPSYDGKAVSPDQGAVTNPHRHLTVHREAGSVILILRTRLHCLEDRFEELTGRRPAKPLVFAPSVDITRGIGAEVRTTLRQLVDGNIWTHATLKYPLLTAGLDDMLLNAFMSLPNNLTSEFERGAQPSVTPGVVRRAEAYMEARAVDPITMSDVARECGCSRSTLYSLFQRCRSVTPLQFLAEVRLRLARERLRSPSPHDTVCSIAYTSGFFHRSRFAKLYRDKFGESPADTLREARGGL